ncbi:MAG: GtrA family protein [Hyphomicrobiaceae bacterium]
MNAVLELIRNNIWANSWIRHYGGFALAGALAFLTDATILVLLTKLAGMSPFAARPIGICVAMVVSWAVNRSVTFHTRQRPSLVEFLRFAAVAWTAQGVNYAIFAAILLLVPGTEPLIAFFLACLVAMFVSYTGYRFGVFGGRGRLH